MAKNWFDIKTEILNRLQETCVDICEEDDYSAPSNIEMADFDDLHFDEDTFEEMDDDIRELIGFDFPILRRDMRVKDYLNRLYTELKGRGVVDGNPASELRDQTSQFETLHELLFGTGTDIKPKMIYRSDTSKSVFLLYAFNGTENYGVQIISDYVPDEDEDDEGYVYAKLVWMIPQQETWKQTLHLFFNHVESVINWGEIDTQLIKYEQGSIN